MTLPPGGWSVQYGGGSTSNSAREFPRIRTKMKLPVEFSRSVLCVTLLAGLVWTGFLITPQPVSAGEVGGTTHTTSSSQSSLVFGTGLLSGGGGFEFVGDPGLFVNNLFLHDGLISGFGLPLTAVDAY